MATTNKTWVAWEATHHRNGWVGQSVIPHAAAAGPTKHECALNYRLNRGLRSDDSLPPYVQIRPLGKPPRPFLMT